jgi:hypothetical protein
MLVRITFGAGMGADDGVGRRGEITGKITLPPPLEIA